MTSLGDSATPLVLHIPHASDAVPDEVCDQLLLGDEELRGELLRMFEMIDQWPREVAWRVAVDQPFPGTVVPLQFYGDTRIHSVMIELRRDLYMDEETGERLNDFAGCAAAVQAALRDLAAPE